MSTSVAEVSIFSRYGAVLASIAVHAVAIAWVTTRPGPGRDAAPTRTGEPIELIEVAPTPQEPVAVTLLDDDSVAPATPGLAPAASASTRQPGAATARIASGANNPSEPPTVETPPAVPPKNPLLTMRRPEAPKLDPHGLTGDFTEAFLRNSRPLQPNENPTEQVAAELDSAAANLKNPRWVANASPDEVTQARASVVAMRDQLANRELQPDGAGRKSEHKAFRMQVAADGSARITDKRNLQTEKIPIKGTFDITDAFMRSQGMDPYASYKLKVLDETRAERVAMGKVHRTQQLAQSRQHMQRNLERLWATTTDLAARKQALFELWDECAETGSDELVTGGRSAREHVVGFIRSKLPAGSADAYTTDEVARLNGRRRSQATFAPYL